MNLIFKILTVSLLLVPSSLVAAGSNLVFAASKVGHTPSEFNIANHYNYRVDSTFPMSSDSIEAKINIPSNSLGGVIMGSFSGYDSIYHNYNLEVDSLGRIKYVHDDNKWNYTFLDSNVMDSSWHHVALVRDDSQYTLSLYLDGELNETIDVKFEDQVTQQRLYIGVNPCFWNKSKKKPLEGKVSQVTIYHGAISQERVREDMNNKVITNSGTDAILMGNWYLGESWTERIIKDTSDYHNNCHLETYEKYVGLADDRDYDYSFMILPDIQCMNRYKHTRFSNMVDWIVDNSEALKTKFLMVVGDLSDVGTVEEYYRTSAQVMNKLNNVIPWCFIPGNHDYDDNCYYSRKTSYLNKHYPYSLHSTLPGFGGIYEKDGSVDYIDDNGETQTEQYHMDNSYYLIDVGDIKYCIINVEFGARMEIFRWASRLCDKYSDRRIIVQTHAWIDPTGHYTLSSGAGSYNWTNYIEWSRPEAFWNELAKKHSNIFMAVGGHYCSDDIIYTELTGDNGNKVHSFLIDNQGSVYNNGGIGEDCVAIFKVNEKKKTMSVAYYSPYHDAVYNIQNQFEFYFGDSINSTIGK